MLQSKSKDCLLTKFPLARGYQSFILFGPSTDWVRPTDIMESNLLYSKFTNLIVNLIQKTPSQKPPEQCLTTYLGTVTQPN